MAQSDAKFCFSPGPQKPDQAECPPQTVLYPVRPGYSRTSSWLYKYSSVKDRTHLSLRGGSYSLPEDQHQQLLQMLALDVKEGKDNYLVENKTEVFPLNMDVDWDDVEPRSLNDIMHVILAWQKIVRQTFAPAPFQGRVLVCETLPKYLDDHRVKTGMHLIWPEILVKKDTALDILQAVLDILDQTPRPAPLAPWKQVLDPCVFLSNGLRVNYSLKAEKCGVCRGEKNKKCQTCRDTGKLTDRRFYRVTAVLDFDGGHLEDEEKRHGDVLYSLAQSSIRRPSGDQPTPVTHLTKRPFFKAVETSAKKTKADVAATAGGPAAESKESDLKKTPIDKSDQRFKEIQQILDRDPIYSGTLATKVTKIEYQRKAHHFFVSSNSHQCMNKSDMGIHRSNHVWFEMTPNGMFQRCYCKCSPKTPGAVPCSKHKYYLEATKPGARALEILWPGCGGTTPHGGASPPKPPPAAAAAAAGPMESVPPPQHPPAAVSARSGHPPPVFPIRPSIFVKPTAESEEILALKKQIQELNARVQKLSENSS